MLKNNPNHNPDPYPDTMPQWSSTVCLKPHLLRVSIRMWH